MAEITLTIPNAQVRRAIDALCEVGGYSGDVDDPAACRAFAQSVIAQFIRQTVMQAERQRAMADVMSAITVDPITIN